MLLLDRLFSPHSPAPFFLFHVQAYFTSSKFSHKDEYAQRIYVYVYIYIHANFPLIFPLPGPEHK